MQEEAGYENADEVALRGDGRRTCTGRQHAGVTAGADAQPDTPISACPADISDTSLGVSR